MFIGIFVYLVICAFLHSSEVQMQTSTYVCIYVFAMQFCYLLS